MEGELDRDTAKSFLDSMAGGMAYPDMAKPILQQEKDAPAPTDPKPNTDNASLPPLPTMPPPPTPPKPKAKPKPKAPPKQKDLTTIAFDDPEDVIGKARQYVDLLLSGSQAATTWALRLAVVRNQASLATALDTNAKALLTAYNNLQEHLKDQATDAQPYIDILNSVQSTYTETMADIRQAKGLVTAENRARSKGSRSSDNKSDGASECPIP
eukprot:15439509-Alexandrium_andersonii.AAC.1